MTKWLFAAAFGLCLASGAADATGRSDLTPTVNSIGLVPAQKLLRLVDDQWFPIGCVREPDDCEHLAHDRGYHHHRIVRDSQYCHHHPHLLCLVAD